MLSNYLLNQGGLVAQFNRANKIVDKVATRYVKEQDVIVDRFYKNVRKNISNYIKVSKPSKTFKLLLPISNALYQLWNDSWYLGYLHAARESKVNFSNSLDDLITFASKNDKEPTLDELIKARKKFDEQYTNSDGSYKLKDYLRDTGRRGSYNETQQQQFINEIEGRKNRLEEKIFTKINEQTSQPQSAIKPPREKKVKTVKPKTEKPAKKEVIKPLREPNVSNVEVKPDIPSMSEQEKIQIEAGLKKQNNIIRNVETKYISSKNKNPFDAKYNVDAYIRRIKGDNYNITDRDRKIYGEDLRKAHIDALKERNELERRLNKNIEAATPKQPKESREKRKYKSTEDIKRKQDSIRRIRQRTSDNEQLLPTDLKSTEFGRLYLDKRINAVSSSLDNDYKDSLKDIIPKYFTSSSPNRDKVLYEEIDKELNYNTSNTERIAMTELGHAYNLGRLDYFYERKIEYVKWETRVEHLRREAIDSTKRSYKSIDSSYSLRGVVCPVCWERSTHDSGYGKGIYELSEVMSNPQLFPLIHVNCGCFLSEANVKDDDDDKDVRKKKKVESDSNIFSNNVSIWAAGGAVGILGTALMYAMFRRTRTRIPQPKFTPSVATKVASRIPFSITKYGGKKEVVKPNLTILNTDIPLPQLTSNKSIPLLPLDIPEVPVELPELKPRLLTILDTNYPGTKTNYIDKLTTVNEESLRLLSEVSLSDLNSVNSTDIRSRLLMIRDEKLPEIYTSYKSSNYNATQRKDIVKSFKEDIEFINQQILALENNNGKLYAQERALLKVREDVRQLIRNNITDVDIPDINAVVSSNPTVRNLEHTLSEIQQQLRVNNRNLANDSYYGDLIKVKEDILSNADLANDYIKYNTGKVNSVFNSLGKLEPAVLPNLEKQLIDLERKVNRLNNLSYLDYVLGLDEVNYAYTRLTSVKSITDRINTVDLTNIIKTTGLNEDVLLSAATIFDNKKGIELLENRITYLTTLIQNKYVSQ